MSALIDLTGATFGRLTVVNRMENRAGRPYWLARCTCGTYREVQGGHLRSRSIVSCGCLRREPRRAT